MTTRFPLEVVMDLTRKQEDVAVAALADLRSKERAAAAPLEMLQTCRMDYQCRFERSSLTGIGNEQWRNYHEFLSKLDQAILQQAEVVAKCRSRSEAGLKDWRTAHVKVQSFEVLLMRHQRGEAQRQSRSEQRDQDERSAAGHLRRQQPS